MKDLGKIVLHIPAREGSKRVPKKNMKLINDEPMISYVIKSSINSNVTEHIYVNTDSDVIEQYVNCNFIIKVYKRKKILASDNATSDQFNYDIINALNPDTLMMINPVCPLIESIDIINAVRRYQNSNCDTLISSSATKMQGFCGEEGVNINVNEELMPSQMNETINILNWAITIWDAKLFKKRMTNLGFASLGKNRIFYELDCIKSIKVSEIGDFKLAEKILKLSE